MDDRERQPELYDKEFNRITDRYLFEGKIDPDDYAGLTDSQKDCIQWYKRAINRFNAKHGQGAD